MATVRSGEVPISASDQRLVSWKGIAEYFECDVRTAKRWEHERKLPVHRAPGGKRGYVYAYVHELDEWLQTAGEGKQSAEDATKTLTSEQFLPQTSAALSESTASYLVELSKQTLSAHSGLRGWLAWASAGVGVLFIIAFALWSLASRHTVGAKSVATLASSPRDTHIPVGEAEKLYLRGRYFWNMRTADGLSKAIDAYTQAIVKDPSYSEPYAGLAEVYELMPQFSGSDLGEALTRAKSAADRAIQLNPNLAAAHRAKAFALFYWDWDIDGSDAEFKRALELDPNSPETHHWYASTLLNRHQGLECVAQIDEALRLNPTSTAIATDAAFFHASFDDFRGGIKRLRELAHTQPALSTSSDFLRTIEFAEGNYPDFIADTRKYALLTGNPDDALIANSIAQGWNENGKTGMLRALLKAQEFGFKHGTETGFRLGQTYILLGQPDRALRYFNSALDKHFIMLVTMEDTNWGKGLSGDPGYAKLFEEIRKRMHSGYPTHRAVLPVFENLSQ